MLPAVSLTLGDMRQREYEEARIKRERELERARQQALTDLRVLAWCAQRDKYAREPVRVDGGRRGTGRIATLTFYLEVEDWRDGHVAVKEIIERRPE